MPRKRIPDAIPLRPSLFGYGHSTLATEWWFTPLVKEFVTQNEGLLVLYQPTNQTKRKLFILSRDPGRMQELFCQRCQIKRARDAQELASACSPDSTPQVLLACAKTYFNEVLENPALPLFALEDPHLYQQIYLAAQQAKLEDWFRYTPESQQRLFLCRSLRWLIEQSQLKLSDTPRQVVEAHEQFAQRRLSQKRLGQTIAQIEYAVKNKNIASHHTKPDSLLAAIWLSRKIIYNNPEQALSTLLFQWQRNAPSVYAEFVTHPPTLAG
jgi:hypothetical protein